jgi:2-polyprenyl-6-methoxyphenol hydroxylase-like FAD-dependent oxidoreductase
MTRDERKTTVRSAAMGAEREIEVLVVGSGGSGLVVAAGLAQAGVSCRVIEKNAGPFPGSRGKGLLPRALELLDNLGVLDAIRAEAEWCEAEPLSTLFYKGQVIGAMQAMGPPTPDSPYLATAIVPQWHTERVLRDVLASTGVNVEWSTELVNFTQDERGVTASVRGPGEEIRSIRAAYLVGGDGARSTVRKSLGIKSTGGAIPDAHWLVGDVEIDGLAHPEPTTGANGYGWLSASGALFVRRFVRGEQWQFQAPLGVDEHGRLPPPTLETMQRLIDERSGRTDIRLHGLSSWVNTFSVHVGYAERFRSERVFIAGEAAHVQTGGGLCSAIYDSSNLAWKLATVLRGGPAWLLDTYEAERGQSARHEVEMTRALMYEATGLDSKDKGRTEPDSRQLLAALNDPEMHRQMSGLIIRYRESPLSLNWGDTGNRDILAGDRAPDSPCRDPLTGQTIRLFDLYRGPHWTLLGFGPRGAEVVGHHRAPDFIDVKVCTVLKPGDVAVAEHQAVIDAEGHAHRAFEIDESAVVLVRPDNYVGLIARPADVAGLDTYFDRLRLHQLALTESERTPR